MRRARLSPPARETLLIFGLAAVGVLVTLAVLFGDALVLRLATGDWVGDLPGWGDYSRSTWTTLAEPHWQLWLALLGVQAAVWAILAPLLVREYRALGCRTNWLDLAATFGFVVLVFVLVDVARFRNPISSPLPGHWLKLTVLTWLGLVVASIAGAGLVRIGRMASTFDGDAAEHGRLHRAMRFFVAGAGVVIGAAVLAGGALAQASVEEYPTQEEAPVLAYGLLLSALLAAIYAPVFLAVRGAGERLADSIAEVPPSSDPAWLAAHARRREVGAALGLEASLLDSLRAGLGVLAPLISAALSLLLPGG